MVTVRQIPLARPYLDGREEELVLDVLRSGNLALGPMYRRFEEAFADVVGTRHAVACSSGTAGLQACLHRLGVGPGDVVFTSSF
jgi:perosamine synthetase